MGKEEGKLDVLLFLANSTSSGNYGEFNAKLALKQQDGIYTRTFDLTTLSPVLVVL